MHYSVCVVDDAAADTAYVAALVENWAAAAQHTVTVRTFPSAEAFLFACADGAAVDILLLDIEMGGMNGLQLARQLRTRNDRLQLVFLTGFPDHIAEGYDVAALHYLLKPVDPQKLAQVLTRAAARLARQPKRLAVRSEEDTVWLPLDDIFYLEAQKQYVLVHTADGVLRVHAGLAATLAQLDETFFQCQRSFAVNLHRVQRVRSGCVVLQNGAEVPISRGMAQRIGKEIIRLF